MLIGVDIEGVGKMKKIINEADIHDNNEGILNSVFSGAEIKIGLTKKRPDKYFAVRFAGKEAFLKALGVGLQDNYQLSDIEFLNDNKGWPYVNCAGAIKQELLRRNVKKVNVSFSHSR